MKLTVSRQWGEAVTSESGGRRGQASTASMVMEPIGRSGIKPVLRRPRQRRLGDEGGGTPNRVNDSVGGKPPQPRPQ